MYWLLIRFTILEFYLNLNTNTGAKHDGKTYKPIRAATKEADVSRKM